MSVKILLTHGYFLNEDEKEKEIMKPYPPLGILYLSAYLEQHGFDNSIHDSTFSSFEKLCTQLLTEKPDLIGIYTNLMTKLNVLKIISFVTAQSSLNHTKIVLGGPEVRNHVDNFLNYGAAIIVLGEGEETMLALAQNYTSLNNNNILNEIKSIAFKNKHEKIIHTEARSLLKNIDELSFPNRKKINLQLYFDAWKNKHGQSAISVSTMRGCPYTCKWCSRAVYGQSYRRRSAKLVADEIEHIQKNYEVDTLWFVDDVFTVSHKWLKEFRDEIVTRKINLAYECITRADRLNEESMRLLKESGCFRVWIGAESGSQKIIDAMDRRVSVEQVREMIQLSKKHKIQSGTFIMLGYPGETEADIEETIHHLKVSDPDFYTITIAYPIKGTPLYSDVEAKFVEQLDWQSSTDRDIDFKRTYRRAYYDFALRRLYNEVAFHKEKANKAYTTKLLMHKAKSLIAKGGMLWHRTLS
ncbi:MAG: radical SAM protein [Bacteroidetes bacterium]|nr:radical SAM protein [Bacteroidota bacterium]